MNATTWQIWKRLIAYAENNRRLTIGSVLAALVSVAASVAGPLLIGRAVDRMIGPGAVGFRAIGSILLGLGVIYAIGSLFAWILTYWTNKIAYQTVNRMRADLFDQLNRLPLKFHDNTPRGDTISRFVNDMDAVSDGILQGMSTFLTGIFTIIGAIGFMLYISPLMTLVVLLSAPVSYFVARYITKSSQKLFREQAKFLGSLNGYAEEIIGGQRIVQAFHYEEHINREFQERNEELYKVGVKSQFYGSLANPTTRIVNNITFSIVAVIGSLDIIYGGITVGDLSSFLIYSNLFAKPFNEVTGVLAQIQAATASLQRIFAILDHEPEIPDTSSARELPAVQSTIVFDHVSFRYTPDRPLIADFSLEVPPGTRVAIVGQTGAGKTTLVNLLMRFYDVDGGSIRVDGTDIRSLTRDSLRKSFGMVLQDTWLFGGSIRDNIAYGKPEATEEEIMAAAKASHAHGFIMRLPEGYDTLLSASGDNLSQGQKQLLTIARVMLADPPMLILDEATSSIDTRTELRIQKAFLRLMEGRTSFIIAHRLSTIREADLILFMRNGNIEEKGTHEQLLELNGGYAALYNSQFAAV
ncbi:ABC transporter ATP-binding protein [Gorillibacterium massiliense]|uniref:ABC transporter ATP-binding protein n=1 Tax=Gorillibacterium massiliense TaxID=1280390 RepID=UPI0004B0AEFD|nr:ABC transporter ATP-binding protein [Gorillibacterium massiliense]